MARSSRSSGGRPASRPAPQRSAPVPARAAPASVPATAGQQQQGPGMMAGMMQTAGGVAMGSVMGSGISNMLFGGRSHEQPVAAAPEQQSSFQQGGQGISCDIQAKGTSFSATGPRSRRQTSRSASTPPAPTWLRVPSTLVRAVLASNSCSPPQTSSRRARPPRVPTEWTGPDSSCNRLPNHRSPRSHFRSSPLRCLLRRPRHAATTLMQALRAKDTHVQLVAHTRH